MGNVIHWEKNNVNNFCTILIQRDNKTVEKCQDQHLSRKTPPNQRMTQQNSCNKRWGLDLGKNGVKWLPRTPKQYMNIQLFSWNSISFLQVQ